MGIDMINLAAALVTIFFFIDLLFYAAKSREICIGKAKEAPEPSCGWPILGHLPLFFFSGATPAHHVMASLADRYGPAVTLRLGKNRALLISSRELAKQCLSSKDRMLAGRPRSAAIKHLSFDFACFALDTSSPHWRETRKIVFHKLLSIHRVESYQSVWISEVGMWVEGLYGLWEDNPRRPKMTEMKDMLWRLTVNVMTRMGAGKRLSGFRGDDDEEEAEEYRKVSGKLLHLLTVPDIGGFLPFLQCFDLQGHERASKETAKKMDGILQTWMEERVGKLDENRYFLDVLLSMQRDGKLPQDHPAETFIKATMLILMTAGAEITATELAWALSLLMNNRHVLKRAQAELDQQVGQDRAVHPSDVQDLPYLRAILKEAMRLYPVGPILVPHEATEDCTVGGFHVRAGTHVLVNVWKIHREASVWEDPPEFRPERFMGEGHAADVDVWGHHFELLPFGSGRRSCMGRCLAMQLMHLVLGSLLHGFDWETTTPDGKVDMTEGFAFSLLKLKPLPLRFTPRLSASAYLKT